MQEKDTIALYTPTISSYTKMSQTFTSCVLLICRIKNTLKMRGDCADEEAARHHLCPAYGNCSKSASLQREAEYSLQYGSMQSKPEG